MNERFWSKVVQGPACWTWAAGCNSGGYGNFKFAGKTLAAHRVSWELENGPVPDGMMVLHKCDNPSCIRPDHLFLGTSADNMKDKVAKGRQARGEVLRRTLRPSRGTKNGNAVLSEDQVREIRSSWSFRVVTQKDLAKKYGVSLATIARILRGVQWQHII